VLDDVVLHCKRGQAGIDADVAALREASQRARLLYLMRVTQGQVGVTASFTTCCIFTDTTPQRAVLT
jgi:hypothetical protein